VSTISKNRTAFHRELERLQDEVLVLGSMVEKATLRAVDALRARDVGTARAIEAEDTLINRKRFEIEEAVLSLIATQQPMASDLRQLAAALHIVTDLERMGDYAAADRVQNICERVVFVVSGRMQEFSRGAVA
jgi:phosphate transport system protein